MSKVDYVRQLDPPRPYRSNEVEPQLWSIREESRTVFGDPEITKQPTETMLRSLAQPTSTNYKGQIRRVDISPFGCIEVHHGDIFSFWDQEMTEKLTASELGREAEGKSGVAGRVMVLPMAPNLLPYRGLGLEAYDRGGPAVVKATYEAALQCSHLSREDIEQGANINLEAGDALEVPMHFSVSFLRRQLDSLEVMASNPLAERLRKEKDFNKIIFMIMPWIWQGSPIDAEKRFRICAREALHRASKHCQQVAQEASAKNWKYLQGAVAIPSIGGGIYGYEPRNSSLALVEEAFEMLLQVEAEQPSYALQRIAFVDSDLETAEAFASAVVEVSRRWLPAERLTTAPEWWGKKTRRLLVLPDVPNFFWRRFKVKFKKRHGVKKRQRVHYLGNVKPRIWRAHKVLQPPPLLVHQTDGAIADHQLQARPYFYRGVSHWLFPSRRGGIHVMKRSASGQWVGVLRHMRSSLIPAIRPKL
ncbi:unnamed protein product [Durusdinium trenchii]|uniref:Macro domain-containing protein n=1 Tax=Durusdinium trenchii TaxID=1381693 RepID=A0ABP0SRM5_9DINO